MNTAWQNFHHATLELVSSAPIKQRLTCAYQRHLAELQPEQLPAVVREPFARIANRLSGVQPLRGEDAVTASVRKMSNHQADECASSIVDIFAAICRQTAPEDESAQSSLNSMVSQRVVSW